jgi:hypothetical protein
MSAKKRKYNKTAAPKPLIKPPLTHGEKISETKQLIKKLSQKFPIGEMVSEKYHPDNVGIIAGKITAKRHAEEYINAVVDVLWITNKWFGDGQVRQYHVNALKIRKEKKVV